MIIYNRVVRIDAYWGGGGEASQYYDAVLPV